MTFRSILSPIFAASVALTLAACSGATDAPMAADAMKPADAMASDAMKPDAMATDSMAADAMKPDAMATDAMKADPMKPAGN